MSAHGVAADGHADPVVRALATASGILPDQGPIGVFVHHNTLHAFQHLPFHEGVCAGAAALGARPYLSLDEFRDAWRTARISVTRSALARSSGGAPRPVKATWVRGGRQSSPSST